MSIGFVCEVVDSSEEWTTSISSYLSYHVMLGRISSYSNIWNEEL